MVQAGGSVTIGGQSLMVGFNAGSFGVYSLSGGSLVVGNSENIGFAGQGVFNQTGGTNTVNGAGAMFIGQQYGSSGSYTFSGGNLSAGGNETVGYSGVGVFEQSGGTNDIGEALCLGNNGGSTGTYSLSAGTLIVNSCAYIGGGGGGAGGAGTLTISSTGVMTVTGTLQVWGQGDMNISGTVAKVGALSIATGGLVNVNSALLITSDDGKPASAELAIQKYIGSGAITSNFASANGLGIAYADGSDAGILNADLQKGQIVVEPDLLGDADLNGTVNFHDLQNLLGGFGNPGFWDQGNFNGHATVDFNDLQLLLGNFGASTMLSYSELSGIQNLMGEFGDVAVPNPDGTGFTLVSVPDPATITLAAIAFAPVLCRRARTRRPLKS